MDLDLLTRTKSCHNYFVFVLNKYIRQYNLQTCNSKSILTKKWPTKQMKRIMERTRKEIPYEIPKVAVLQCHVTCNKS